MWADLFGCDSNVSMPSAEFHKGPPLRQLSTSNHQQSRVSKDAEQDFSTFVSKLALKRSEPAVLPAEATMEMDEDNSINEEEFLCYDPMLTANIRHQQQTLRFGDEILQPLVPVSQGSEVQQQYFAPINMNFTTPYHSGHTQFTTTHTRMKRRWPRSDNLTKRKKNKSAPKVGKRKKLYFAKPCPTKLTPEQRLQRREKQICLGKGTEEYKLYAQNVPKEKRLPNHPQTPDVHAQSSKRTFDREVSQWRRGLHTWKQTEYDIPVLKLKH